MTRLLRAPAFMALGFALTACTTIVVPPGPTRVVTVTVTPSPQPTTGSFYERLLTPSPNQSTAVLDMMSLTTGVINILTQNYKLIVSNVSCPAGEPAVVGNTFACAVTIDGAQKHVQITVKTSDGQYEVAQPQ